MKITWYQSTIFNALGLSACLLFAKTLNAENVLYEEAELSISPIEAGKPLRLEIHPKEFTLSGNRQQLQILVTAFYADGESADLTRAALYKVANADCASVNDRGVVVPKIDGSTTVRASVGKLHAEMVLDVKNQDKPEPVSFKFQTLPVLSKAGCSMGACHGAPHGKGGFRLSLRAFDPVLDLKTLVHEEFGRRVNLLEPERSLLLAKPRMEVAHEGGRRLRKGDLEHQLLKDWIREGCVADMDASACTGIRITPGTGQFRRLPHHVQQFRVEASFADGSTRDVTHLAVFESSDETVLKVSRHGLAVGVRRGEAAVIVRYLEHIQSTLLSFVQDVSGFEWKAPNPVNFVDSHVYKKLRKFQYLPSEPCRDEEFLRRVYLDVTGLLPTPEQSLRFLEDKQSDKRQRLIDELLDSQNYTAFWSQKWGDLLKVSAKQMGISGALKFHNWIQQSIVENRPYDEFARSILNANGSNFINPATNFYRSGSDTSDHMESTTQLFMGTRIGCAKCHNHPYERWTQDNYYGLSAFFNRINTKKTGRKDEVVVWMDREGEVHHPVSKKVVEPWVPGGEDSLNQKKDRRKAFTQWLTSQNNPFFAKVEVNRIWTHLMGRGIVEPFDDFRDTNPPANKSLLEALAKDFAMNGFDRRRTIRTILLSNTYQASSRANEFNRDDKRFFSHYPARRLTAEQLLDALGDLTGMPEKFQGVRASTRATQLPAPDLKPHDRGKIGEIEFLKVFGMPERQTVCECERGDETSLGQALELYNGKTLHRMLTHSETRHRKLIRQNLSDDEILRELYLRAYARKPDPRETEIAKQYIKSAENREKAYEDFVWALVNKDEFLFQH